MKTLYDIEVNPTLMWDYVFTPDEMQNAAFFTWYLGRLLEYGTAEEIRRLPKEVIALYLSTLHISRRVRRFWEWYLKQ